MFRLDFYRMTFFFISLNITYQISAAKLAEELRFEAKVFPAPQIITDANDFLANCEFINQNRIAEIK